MKHVLMVCYYFPPIGGPGVYRSLKFCKYLPRCGWRPIVVCGHGSDPDFGADSTLLRDVPPQAELHRLDFPWETPWRRTRGWLFGHGLGRIGHHLGFFFDFPCRFREWSRLARDCAARLAEAERPSVIYTTSPPFSAHLVGKELKRRFGVPWVADFRDPWAKNQILMQGMPRWMLRRHARAEGAVLAAADHVLVVSDGMREDFIQRSGQPLAKLTTITNGFDPEDFPAVTPAPQVDDRVRLVNTGSYYGAYNPQPLRAALAAMAGTNPDLLKQLELVFVGGTPVRFDDLPGLQVKVFPRVDHTEALSWQREAHVLLLVWTSAVTRANVSGKIFEYLAARRPILALVPPDCAAAAIVRESGAGLVASPDDPLAAVQALEQCMRIARGELPPLRRNQEVIDRFSRRRLTGKLVRVFDVVMSSEGAVAAPRPL